MAKRKAGEEPDVLYRVAKFEIFPTSEVLAVLVRMSTVLREVWNDALWDRLVVSQNLYPLWKRSVGEEVARTLSSWFAPGLFDQINKLTLMRNEHLNWRAVPRSFEEETLDGLEAGFKSFFELKKRGDVDARPPKFRYEGDFTEIPGRFGFKVEDGNFILNPGGFVGEEGKLRFPIPEYQQELFRRAKRLKKFTLYRDERSLDKPGRFWISVAYEIEKPDVVALVPDDIVYVAIGASSVGILSRERAEVIKLWRPDKYWKPKIESLEKRLEACLPDSRKWHRLNQAKRIMQKKMAAQQKQDQREVVALDLIAGQAKHFVLKDFVIRSKKGKLADGSDLERGGSLGLNWMAQNTGSFARLAAQLEEKAKERGSKVHYHRLVLDEAPPSIGHKNKLWMADKLRESFLASLEVGVAV